MHHLSYWLSFWKVSGSVHSVKSNCLFAFLSSASLTCIWLIHFDRLKWEGCQGAEQGEQASESQPKQWKWTESSASRHELSQQLGKLVFLILAWKSYNLQVGICSWFHWKHNVMRHSQRPFRHRNYPPTCNCTFPPHNVPWRLHVLFL